MEISWLIRSRCYNYAFVKFVDLEYRNIVDIHDIFFTKDIYVYIIFMVFDAYQTSTLVLLVQIYWFYLYIEVLLLYASIFINP